MRDVRRRFIDGFYSIDGVVDSYRSWLRWIFYVICVRFNFSTGVNEYVFFRGLKRGDRRYGFLTCRKFDLLSDLGSGLVYFGFGYRGRVESSALHVVLEYDSNVISLIDAWLNVGCDYNLFITRVRKLFGDKVSVVRVWESHESGFPHIHAILIFHNYIFSGYSSRKRRRLVYRVSGVDYRSLKRCWVHGFSDFEMVSSFSGGVRYLSKYLAKSTSADFAGVKGIRGLAMCWIFRKRSFSVSGSLFSKGEASVASRAVDHDGILPNSNSNSLVEDSFPVEVETHLIFVGIDLFGNSMFHRVEHWRLFGFCKCHRVLWDDWFMHFVSPIHLKLVDTDGFVSNRSYYDLSD